MTAVDDVEFGSDDEDATRGSKPQSGLKKMSKQPQGGNLPTIGLGVCSFVILGVGAFLLFGRGGGEDESAPTAITPISVTPPLPQPVPTAPATQVPISATLADVTPLLTNPPPIAPVIPVHASATPADEFDPSEYGGLVPEGLVLSPTLIRELELSFSEMAAKELVLVPKNLIRGGVKLGIREMRAINPKLFCVTPEGEAHMAQGGGDREKLRQEYGYYYNRLMQEEIDLPAVVPLFHDDVMSGKASIPRVFVLGQFMAGKLLKETGQSSEK